MYVLTGLLILVLLAVVCVAVANFKGRNPWLWGILGFLCGPIALIVIAARPRKRPRRRNSYPVVAGGVGIRRCSQCDAENTWESVFCTNCGAGLRLEPEVDAGVVALARFLTPLVGLIVGLLFALILLQATTPSAESIAEDLLGQGVSQSEVSRLKDRIGMPPVVFFWPVSPGLESMAFGGSAAGEMWERLRATLEIMILGGGLAVLLAWGLALALGRPHPAITAGRMWVAALAAMPVFWLGLMLLLVLVRYFDWLPPLGYEQLWDDPATNIRQLFWPIFTTGLLGGLWAALEMRSRGEANAIVVLARALGLVLRHGGMLLSGVILLEIVFAIPGVGRILLSSVYQGDFTILGASAAIIIWLALLSRFLGNLLLAAVDERPPVRNGASGGTEIAITLAIGGVVTIGLLVLLLVLPFVAPEDPQVTNLQEAMVEPGGDHWLGTDRGGRDILSRVLHGGRTAALIGLPMGLLAFLVGFPMVIARLMLDRARIPVLVYGVEGVLEGLLAVPWLVIGILIQANWGLGWPFLALAVILVPRALSVGWAMGAGAPLEVVHLATVALRLGALFLAAAVAMSTAFGFVGVGVPPNESDLGVMLAQGTQLIVAAPWTVIFPGLFLSLIAATWLVVAALLSRKGPEYQPVGWAHTMS